MPAAFQQFFTALREKKLFVTSLDRRIAQIYPMEVWRQNEKFFETYREDPKQANKIAFNAADLGVEAETGCPGADHLSPGIAAATGDGRPDRSPVRLQGPHRSSERTDLRRAEARSDQDRAGGCREPGVGGPELMAYAFVRHARRIAPLLNVRSDGTYMDATAGLGGIRGDRAAFVIPAS